MPVTVLWGVFLFTHSSFMPDCLNNLNGSHIAGLLAEVESELRANEKDRFSGTHSSEVLGVFPFSATLREFFA